MARFAAAPPAGVPLTAQQFGDRLIGGYAFLSDDSRASGTPIATTSSRASAPPTRWATAPCIRGGFGVYSAPFQIQGVPGPQQRR